MSGPAILAPEARAELVRAVRRIAKDNALAAQGFRSAVGQAARLIGAHPDAGRIDLRLAPPRYRFWSMSRFHYVLVYEASARPPRIARILHTARDLAPLLAELREPPDAPEG